MAFKKVIVTTSINSPTKALRKFAAMPDWHLVIVGDLKTPKDFDISGATYLAPVDQEKMDPVLSEMIGWNCIQRRNFGLIWAYQNGAEVIATVDDDNIPYDFWGSDCLVNREVELDSYDPKGLVFDPLSVTNYSHLWHRGYPLQWLTHRMEPTKKREKILVDVDAGLWNGDPDIDAVCRMEHAPNVEFSDSIFPLTSGKIAPFNSQNTMISRRALPEYFLFPRIGRMDDIWAAFWLQAKGFRIAFSKASVFQERNVHDLTRDFEAEILGYTKSHSMLRELTESSEAIWKYLPENSQAIYQRYRSHLK